MTCSAALKEEIIRKVLSSDRIDSMMAIATNANITVRTIRRWIKIYKEQLPINMYLSDKGKINAVLQTINNSLEDKSKFCRLKGIMPEQLEEWELELKKSISGGAVSKHEHDKLNYEKQELKKLLAAKDKELLKKDKALAEVAALLELQKKVQKLLEKEGLNLNES
jgi:transposase